MHADEQHMSSAKAARLVDAQLPAFAGQPVRPLSASGTDNWMFRLGSEHVLRFPRRASAVALLARECTFLPRFPDLPLTVPQPVAEGAPGEGYPWPWAVYKWIEGSPVHPGRLASPEGAARDLAGFVRAFQEMPGLDGPIAGSVNHKRGVPIEQLETEVSAALQDLAATFDVSELRTVWRDARDAAPWDGPPRWLHGDLKPGNLLIRDGKLAAVIDFGLMARGDPAVDLLPAWSVFDTGTRGIFLQELKADRDMVRRGRGWALYSAVIDLAWYGLSDATQSGPARRTLAAVLEDAGR